jgi:hypothetical protein
MEAGCGLTLAMADPGPHPPLLLAEFAAALARFLDAHAFGFLRGPA